MFSISDHRIWAITSLSKSCLQTRVKRCILIEPAESRGLTKELWHAGCSKSVSLLCKLETAQFPGPWFGWYFRFSSKMYDHRITEYPKLEETHRDHWIQPWPHRAPLKPKPYVSLSSSSSEACPLPFGAEPFPNLHLTPPHDAVPCSFNYDNTQMPRLLVLVWAHGAAHVCIHLRGWSPETHCWASQEDALAIQFT